MYCQHYGFSRMPFTTTSEAHFFFESSSHREAYAAVTYGVTQRKGILLITGEVGTGKTTLCKKLLNRLDLALREADFLLDGVVFLIGFDRHGLLVELREPALVHRHVLLDGTAGALVFDETFLGGRDALTRRFEARLEGLLAFGLLGEPPLGVVRRRDELLKRDDAFEVSVQ